MIELKALYTGKVQGVGFRWSVVALAERLNLTGRVKNLANGSVEVVAQGTKDELELFLQLLPKECEGARVDHVDLHYRAIKTPLLGFRIDV